ncbi:MAG: tRNA (adenosine(37)-N6)-threonylcarbamoyltransferase complex ATPase subunit type 1 TsaE [Chroococcidiopsidaceae cyanobacterium CP_BM_ER_R8_30]|nr:tRNA (adenosine(37)-N6)-threonylcarbamoyltransferase complex ATPase subunit type 1 TsaE [Chroococcidiopsidaceae cyanobacterium CP_BM_ER_R8_30]
MEIYLPDAAATRSLGVTLGQLLPAGSVILLEGDLGSGKTTLVQGIGDGLGIIEPIVSPTFTLINEYTEGRLPLYHLDLYRLQPTEIMPLHLETYWEGSEVSLGIVAIEWAERLPYKPFSYLSLSLTYSDVPGRQANLASVGEFELAQSSIWSSTPADL